MHDSIFEKYQIIEIDKKRYYIQNLEERSYNLEFTAPFSLEINEQLFLEGSWGNLLIELINFLNKKYQKSLNDFLIFKTDWTNQALFSSEPLTNFKEVNNSLFVNIGLGSVHSVWLIQDLLNFFDSKLLSVTKLIVYRPPGAEPKECRDFFRNQVKRQFKFYYVSLLKKSEQNADIILKNLESINRLMSRVSPAYNDLFLFPNKTVYKQYKKKLLDKLNGIYTYDNHKVKIAEKYLNILESFYDDIK